MSRSGSSVSVDGAGDHVNGYTARGDRELVPSMECLWYVLKKVPQTSVAD